MSFFHDFGNGETISGDLRVSVDGLISGRGLYRWPNGDVYVGDFMNSNRTGSGTFAWSTGIGYEVYEGTFLNDVCHGRGYYWYANEDRYEGNFFNGRKHGEGGMFYSHSNRSYLVGRFLNGEFAHGKWSIGNLRLFYEGEVSRGAFQGRGILTQKLKKSVSGVFNNGKLNDDPHLDPYYMPSLHIPDDFRTLLPTPLPGLPQFHFGDSPPPLLPLAEVDPANCVVRGPGLQAKVTQDEPTCFALVPIDSLGQPIVLTRDNLHFFFDSPTGGGSKPTFPVTLTEVQEKWVIEYTPSLVGRFLLYVMVNRENIAGSPFPIEVTGNSENPKHCLPSHLELTVTAQEETRFTLDWPNIADLKIEFTDLSGADVTHKFRIKISEDNDVTVITYMATIPGTFFLHVRLKGSSGSVVVGSPFTIQVLPSTRVSPLHCIARGPGLSTLTIGVPGKFAVSLMDAQGNPCDPQQGEVRIAFRTEEREKADDFFEVSRGVLRGHHVVQVTGTAVGTFEMAITVDGHDIGGSPFALEVEPVAVNPGLCSVSGSGIYSAVVGEESHFSVSLIDFKGNPCPPLTVLLALSWWDDVGEITEGFDCRTEPDDQIGYHVFYTPLNSGNYKVHVTVNRSDISGSPYSLHVLPRTTEKKSWETLLSEIEPYDPPSPPRSTLTQSLSRSSPKPSPLSLGHPSPSGRSSSLPCHDDPTALFPRLIRLSGVGRNVCSTWVPANPASLNMHDMFILDNNTDIYQWGASPSLFERQRATSISRALDDERKSAVSVHVVDDVTSLTDEETATFWALLGVPEGAVRPAIRSDDADGSEVAFVPFLFVVSDASGEMVFEEVGKGFDLKKEAFRSTDVMVFDIGFEVFLWEGKKSSKNERNYANTKAIQDYKRDFHRPQQLKVTRCKQGGESALIKMFLNWN